MLHINFTSTGCKKKRRRKKPKLNNNKTGHQEIDDGDAMGMLDVYRRTVCCVHSGPSMCMVLM